MAFARDQVSNSNAQSGTGHLTPTATISFAVKPSASSFIVVSVWNTEGDVPSITDNAGNAYQLILSASTGAATCSIYYTNYKLKLPSGTLTLTGTDANSLFWGMQAASYTNSTPGTIIPDAVGSNTLTGTASKFSYNSGSPIASAELFVTAFGQNSSGSSEGVTLVN